MATKQWRQEHREEMRAYRRKWYAANKEHAKAKVTERKKMLQAWFIAHKKTLSCTACGENHPACLDFHHRNPDQKKVSLAWAATGAGWSKEHIIAEIAKCDVLCANCHRKLHWEEKRKGQ